MSKGRYKFNRCKPCFSQAETVNTLAANWILPEGKHILLSKYLHKEKAAIQATQLEDIIGCTKQSLSLRFLHLCLN